MRSIKTAALAALLAAGPAAPGWAAAHRYSMITEDGAEGRPALDLTAPKIVFYCAPGSAACEEAIKELSDTPALMTALLTRSLFLTDRENLEKAARWNSEQPYEYAVVYSTADWPELNGAAMPAILFYSGGAQVCRVEGWRGAAGTEEFKACMGKAGLLSAAARLKSAAETTRLSSGKESAAKAQKNTAAAECDALFREGTFSSEALPAYDDRTLKNAYRLLNHVNFYFPREDRLDGQAALLTELERRGLINENKTQDLHQRLLNAKLFGRAAALKAQYPAYELPVVPPISGSLETGPGEAALYYTKDGETGMEIEKAVRGGTRIIVAGYCHFAKSALEEIEKDPELAPVFEKYALPLVSKVDLGSLKQWNTAHKLQYRITANDADWPGVDFSFSPTFYFLRGGTIVHTVHGWSSERFLDIISEGVQLMLPEMKLSRKLEKIEEKPRKTGAARRKLPRMELGGLLKGLTPAQLHKFCASIRFSSGVFSGAYTEDVREIFGESRVEKLRAYLSGGAKPADTDAGITLGELWSKFDEEQLNRTCVTITFNKGSFGGLNFGEIEDVYGSKAIEEAFAYFTPPEQTPAQ